MQYGYLGMFIVSFLGATSILIPIPYTVLIFTLGKMPYIDPNLLALSAGLGAALGEFFGYIMGYYGRAIISEEKKRKADYILRLFSRYGAITIFIFALTPLPDDLLFIPLGIMRYSFIKAFIPCLMGKISMSLILAYGGRLSNWFIEMIFGGSEGSGLLTMIATTILLVAIIIAMFKIDWERIFPLEEKGKKPP
ncbi:MAG: VTT domain-containing protein, partial [Candidatus Bathyarchaeia archaeon]